MTLWFIVIIWLDHHATQMSTPFQTVEACERQANHVRPGPFDGSKIAAVYCEPMPTTKDER